MLVQLGAGGLIAGLSALLLGCAESATIRRTEEHMGTIVTITVGAGERRGARAIDRAFQRIAEVDATLSHYEHSAELFILNRDGFLDHPSAMLVENLRASLSYARLTDGAFDITTLPILDLYDRSFAEKRIPTPEEIEIARELVDYRQIKLLDERIEIGAGQRITLGGIAKGYAVDLATTALQDEGIGNAIVAAGGDMRVIGRKSDAEDWHIAIQNPRDPSDFVSRLRVPDRAVVTSGDYERFYDPAREYHHIIDPATGRSASSLISVTLISKSAFEADALSTAAFVLGPEKGIALVESLDGVEALFITQSRRVIRSSGFVAYEDTQ